MEISGFDYATAQKFQHSLRLHEGWAPFKNISLEAVQGKTRVCKTLAVDMNTFIEICSRLPYCYPKADYHNCDGLFEALQFIVETLDEDPSLLEEFNRKPFFSGGAVKALKPITVHPDPLESDTDLADEIVSETSALYTFTKHFCFEGRTFTTLLDADGSMWLRAKEFAQALGYRSGSLKTCISHHVDPDRHCSLQDVLSKKIAGFLMEQPTGRIFPEPRGKHIS